jgi:hypothetical protein
MWGLGFSVEGLGCGLELDLLLHDDGGDVHGAWTCEAR